MLIKQAEFLLKELRHGVEIYLKDAKIPKIECKEKWFSEKRGVFVTLSTYPEHELRGCIGYIQPTYPLGEIALRAAISAAVDDPRFEPVSLEALKNIVMEISVLTIPQPVINSSRGELLKQITIGKDGLIVAQGRKSGVLLPQVATEHKMTKEEFLSHTCIKAGLPPGAWSDSDINVMKFQADIFTETSPGGKVVSKD